MPVHGRWAASARRSESDAAADVPNSVAWAPVPDGVVMAVDLGGGGLGSAVAGEIPAVHRGAGRGRPDDSADLGRSLLRPPIARQRPQSSKIYSYMLLRKCQ
jgi:hypothetical protein